MAKSTARRSGGRGGFPLALMLAALWAWVLIPPGTMVSFAAPGATLVICTGHGPLSVARNDIAPSPKAPKSKSDPACAFAGHGAGAATADALAQVSAPVARSIATDAIKADRSPALALAAPPPPAQAPPFAI